MITDRDIDLFVAEMVRRHPGLDEQEQVARLRLMLAGSFFARVGFRLAFWIDRRCSNPRFVDQ